MLMKNGYPVQFVDSYIKDFLNKRYNQSTLHKEKDNQKKMEKAKYLLFKILFLSTCYIQAPVLTYLVYCLEGCLHKIFRN